MKHISKTSQIRRFESLENKALFKVFGDDPVIVYLFRKVSRISAATHLVTDFLSDNEPFKADARQVSLEMVNQASGAVNWGNAFDKKSGEFAATLIKLAMLLEVGYLSGLITEMNFSVIKGEIYGALEQLEQITKNLSVNAKFQVDLGFFDVPLAIQKDEDGRTALSALPGGIFKEAGQRAEYINQASGDKIKTGLERKKVIKDTRGGIMSDRNVLSNLGNGHYSPNKGHNRDKMITDILFGGKRLTVSEISRNFPNLSVKTVQRILNELVSQNLVAKEGRKRWTRYFLTVGAVPADKV
ncbi:MAG: hypothetical protein UX94_C0010G0008 [Parcubacteria group bacterium GW2011_GWA2_47_21]|nr:MAG: hypothetical protein UX94_C0010G0008 [Parcubacteria group bacterium GW2011_GWA2_47_21]